MSRIIKYIDKDALALINAAGLTDETQYDALDTLCTQLKDFGLWTKMKAIYPIIWWDASKHKFNLKDPRDLDVAYRLTFNWTITHSANGMVSNGSSSSYAETYLVPNWTLWQNSTHLSFYSRTVASNDWFSMGTRTWQDFILVTAHVWTINQFNSSPSPLEYVQFSEAWAWFFMWSRTASNVSKIYKNGILRATWINASTTLATWSVSILKIASIGSYKQCAFATIWDWLTDTDSTNFYNIVQAYQTKLGRAV